MQIVAKMYPYIYALVKWRALICIYICILMNIDHSCILYEAKGFIDTPRPFYQLK